MAGAARAPATLLQDLRATAAALRRLAQARARLDKARTLTDQRTWMRARRERTRHLIELGGLVQKAGLVELVDDDRATLLGAFLTLADLLRQGQEEKGGVGTGGEAHTPPMQLAATWRRRGLRAFDAADAGDATTRQ